MFFTPRIIFDEEHLLFRQSVKEFVKREITPNNAQWEQQKMVSRES
ncbi:acyl-CoA dehydrogenase family protein [Echinicola jeungdonensis]|nr:acyl-CoA dehydrogenase family protein [Echinicola jeungdonensis]MDN3670337.1 acyl-CoA dehydrogenase family protein [Echinicola jeungdonensis]